MKKKVAITIMIIVLLLIFSILIFLKLKNSNKIPDRYIEIPDGYIAVFHGRYGKQTYETYIYKENNGQANYGFNYINVISNTISYGNNQWNRKITKRGSVAWTDDVFIVAEENNAYSYVTLPNSDKTYTIEEYMHMFLMN